MARNGTLSSSNKEVREPWRRRQTGDTDGNALTGGWCRFINHSHGGSLDVITAMDSEDKAEFITGLTIGRSFGRKHLAEWKNIEGASYLKESVLSKENL